MSTPPLQGSTYSTKTRPASDHKRSSDQSLNGAAGKVAKLSSIPANPPESLPVLRGASPSPLANKEVESDLKDRAAEFYQMKNWFDYVAICRVLYALNPHDIEPLKGIIKGNAELKVDDQVIHYVSQLLPLIPTEDVNSRVSALKKRCQALWRSHQHISGLQDLAAVLQMRPDDSEAWSWGYNMTHPNREESQQAEKSDSSLVGSDLSNPSSK